MRNVSVLLVSDSAELGCAVSAAVGSVKSCSFSAVPLAAACDVLGDYQALGVVIYQVSSREQLAPLSSMIDRLRQAGPPVAVVAIFDHEDPELELELLRDGVADVLHRPLDVNRVAYLVDSFTLRARLSPEPTRDRKSPARTVAASVESMAASCQDMLWGDCGTLDKLRQQVFRVAQLSTTVLLTGETGTGKTRLARLIHVNSPRSKHAFHTVNCGALAPALLESEMFGHVRGAFTGADADRMGKFAAVGSGTLLLDEIDALPLEAQSKLLRSVDEKVFEPVGSNRTEPVEARLVFATNRQLEDEVAAGRFRRDLYYRLNVVEFKLPPLRERPELLARLVGQFVREFAAQLERGPIHVSPDAWRALQDHDWPGNVRELRNAIECGVAMCEHNRITAGDLPQQVARPWPRVADDSLPIDGSSKLQSTRFSAEIGAINQALSMHSNNRLRAARELGISRVTLYKKLRKYGMH